MDILLVMPCACTHVLRTPPLQASLLASLVVQGFDQNLNEDKILFRSTIIRILWIIHWVLEVQDTFLSVLVP